MLINTNTAFNCDQCMGEPALSDPTKKLPKIRKELRDLKPTDEKK
jgi:hypothetical protein